MNRLVFLPAVLGILLLSACSSSAPAPSTDNQTSGDTRLSDVAGNSTQDQVEDASGITLTGSSGSDIPSSEDVARVVEVTVDDWSYSPSTITVHQGDKLVVRLKGVGGTHMFAIADLGIAASLNDGEIKDVAIPTDKAGSYEFHCDAACSADHPDMKGVIIVE